MITALDPRLLEAVTDTWLAALRYYATGRTPGDLREQAADPERVRGLALEGGITVEQEREQLLAVAGRMGELAAAGLTPVKCWYLGGHDQWLGPYPGAAALSAASQYTAVAS